MTALVDELEGRLRRMPMQRLGREELALVRRLEVDPPRRLPALPLHVHQELVRREIERRLSAARQRARRR